MSDNLATAKCPTCGGVGLEIVMRMQVHETPPRFVPYLQCPRHPCAYGAWGWIEDRHAVFPRG